uniref:NADH dehydrogenase [ubiquinone] 1 alpha subcomplex subunit 3 n=1 Tax=Astatotilapia calliptera TaxID=8154 RepID=A0AAX7VXP5_ASTCA
MSAGIGAFLRNAWNKEPVIMASCGIGLVGAILPFISPLTKYTAMLNAAVPYNYPGKHWRSLCHSRFKCN